MPRSITAVYENGVLKPKEKLDLPEHATIELWITDIAAWKEDLDALLKRVHQRTSAFSPEEIEQDISQASRKA